MFRGDARREFYTIKAELYKKWNHARDGRFGDRVVWAAIKANKALLTSREQDIMPYLREMDEFGRILKSDEAEDKEPDPTVVT